MATIINNGAVADEAVLQISNPYLYIPDPVKNQPLSGGFLYFGLEGRDPQLPQNRKKVYAIQEDGSAVSLEQPVNISSGGVPEYNGSPVVLGVDGAYSYKVLNKNNAQVYYVPKVENVNLKDSTGIYAEELATVGATTTLIFEYIEATTATFYASSVADGSEFNGRLMKRGIDFTVTNESTIELLTPYPQGTLISAIQYDESGDLVSVNDTRKVNVFTDVEEVIAVDLALNERVSLDGGLVAGDGLGGLNYIVVAGGTGTADGENFIDLNNGNQLQLISNTMLIARYFDKVVSQDVSGTYNIDLGVSQCHDITLTGSVTSVNIINANTAHNTTFSLRIKQDISGGKTFTWPSNILWAGGIVPSISNIANTVDLFMFTSYDGVNWLGTVAGQDFK